MITHSTSTSTHSSIHDVEPRGHDLPQSAINVPGTILSARGIPDSLGNASPKNVFDLDPYKSRAERNYDFERRLGQALKRDPRLVEIARRIRLLTGAPGKLGDFTEHEHLEIAAMKHIGGAQDLLTDADTLDACVLATLVKAERAEYDIDQTAAEHQDKPYIQDLHRRLCMFNSVSSPENVIHPWNSHNFDLEIYKVTKPQQFPARIRHLIVDRWRTLLATVEMPADFIKSELGLGHLDASASVFLILESLGEEQRKSLLCDRLHISWSTEEDIADEVDRCPQSPARTINPLGSQFRQHKTGARSNVVRFHDPEDPAVNEWASKAILLGKPVISGPSGHTLRYLNHFDMCRTMAGYTKEGNAHWPTMEEARLVMLANLMPPKSHHSYHEIMLASVGSGDPANPLRYLSEVDYEDLARHPIGLDALDFASTTPPRSPLRSSLPKA